jgi:chromosomal replication initiator protein
MTPRVREILDEVATLHDCQVSDIIGPSRLTKFARARFEAMWRIRRLRLPNGNRYSLSAIAEVFGQRDHTTILHGIRRWEELNNIIDTDDLELERTHLLASMDRFRVALNNAAKRVFEIDGLLSKSESATAAKVAA